MVQNRKIMFRVSESQYERIVLRMENAGYRQRSQFIRDLLLKEDLASFNMLKALYEDMREKNENKAGVSR